MTTIHIKFVFYKELTNEIIFSVSSITDMDNKLEQLIKWFNIHLQRRNNRLENFVSSYTFDNAIIQEISIEDVEYIYKTENSVIYPAKHLERKVKTHIKKHWQTLIREQYAKKYAF
jgi:hypothetical protein